MICICVANSHNVWADEEIAASYLFDRRLYKTLSLLLSHRNKVPVPPSFLMMDIRTDILEEFAEKWGGVAMVRMDFSSLPKAKTLGGIPLFSKEARQRVSEFLFRERCLPLFHPHLDRFEDEYSVGVLLKRGSFHAKMEVVGKGFDASDLRLGNSSPHEFMIVDIADKRIWERRIIDETAYESERQRREIRARKFERYVEYANRNGILLSSLDEMGDSFANDKTREINIPERYVPVPISMLKPLFGYLFTIVADVLDNLPDSERYVASFSYLPNHGWMLWDIYGKWHMR